MSPEPAASPLHAADTAGGRQGARVVIAGGSGFLGRSLSGALEQAGFQVVILGRESRPDSRRIRHGVWDGLSVGPWASELEGAAAVVNLAGKNINCRFTPQNRRLIVESRVHAVRALTEAIRHCTHPPAAWVQASAIGYYGESGDEWRAEDSPRGVGFLAEACAEWEGALDPSALPSTRCVTLRIGVVLGPRGGALEPLARLTRWGLGGAAGTGNQYFSWIHEADLKRIFLHAIEARAWHGVINAVAPNPVTNAELMRELRRALRRPWSPSAPRWAVLLGARLMGTDPSLVLEGQRVKPARLLAEGFAFEYPTLGEALEEIFGS